MTLAYPKSPNHVFCNHTENEKAFGINTRRDEHHGDGYKLSMKQAIVPARLFYELTSFS